MSRITDAGLLALGLGALAVERASGWFNGRDRLAGAVAASGRGHGRRDYDAAAKGARTADWRTPNSSANSEIGYSLDTVRNRSRDLVRNSAWGRKAIEAVVSGMIGNGLRPIPMTGDPALNKRIRDLWDSWGRVCYPLTRTNVYGVQAMLARSWLESGDVFARKRPRYPGDLGPGVPPLQVQVLEGDYVPTWKNQALRPGQPGNRIVQGVEIDRLDRRAAYWMTPVHPGDALSLAGAYGTFEPKPVQASEVLHLYQEARPGQVRGVPILAPVLVAIWDLAGMADAERVRAKAASCLTAFVESPEADQGTPPRPDGITKAEDEVGTLIEDGQGDPVEQLHPGLIGYLPTGKKITVNVPNLPSNFDVYQRVSLHEISAGVGLAYEVLTGDLSQVNFSSIRLGLNEQNRFLRNLRELVFVPQACDPIYEWFLDSAILAGLLPLDTPYRVRWSSPRIESVDPKTDAEAEKAQMRNLTRSRRDVIASHGDDPDEVDAEIALDRKIRKEKGLTSDADPSQTGAGGTVQNALPPDGTTPGEGPQPAPSTRARRASRKGSEKPPQDQA